MADLSNKELKVIVKPFEKQSDLSNEMNKLRQIAKHDSDLKSNLVSLQKELHLQRLKNLRELSDKLKDDGWKYPTVQTLLGL